MKPIDSLTPEELRVECAISEGWFFGNDYWGPGRNAWLKEGHRPETDLPNYPVDANAALTLADTLAEKGWRAGCIFMSPKEVEFTFFRKRLGVMNGDQHEATATGPHAFPLALSRAYLAVIRSTKNAQ